MGSVRQICIFNGLSSRSDGFTQLGPDFDGEAAGDYSGQGDRLSISGDGTIVAIGAPGNDGNGNDSGHVRVFQWDGAAWNQLGNDIDGEIAGDKSGTNSLSNDGTVIAISALRNDGNGNDAGQVRVFAWNGTAWVQRGNDIDGENATDVSGPLSLSEDGNTVLIVHLATLTTATMLAISASSIGMALPGSNAATTSMEKPPTTTSDKTSPFQVTATRLLLVQLTTTAMERIQVMHASTGGMAPPGPN